MSLLIRKDYTVQLDDRHRFTVKGARPKTHYAIKNYENGCILMMPLSLHLSPMVRKHELLTLDAQIERVPADFPGRP